MSTTKQGSRTSRRAGTKGSSPKSRPFKGVPSDINPNKKNRRGKPRRRIRLFSPKQVEAAKAGFATTLKVGEKMLIAGRHGTSKGLSWLASVIKPK